MSDPASIEATPGPPNGWCIQPLHNDDEFTVRHVVWPPTVDLFPHGAREAGVIGCWTPAATHPAARRGRGALS